MIELTQEQLRNRAHGVAIVATCDIKDLDREQLLLHLADLRTMINMAIGPQKRANGQKLLEAKELLQTFVNREEEFAPAFGFGKDDVLLERARALIKS